MDAEQLAEIEARAAKATPGPWRVGSAETWHVFGDVGNPALMSPMHGRVLLRMNQHVPHDADAAFIAAARDDVPALCATLREARADLARVTAERDRALRERDEALLGQCSASLADVQRLAREWDDQRDRADSLQSDLASTRRKRDEHLAAFVRAAEMLAAAQRERDAERARAEAAEQDARTQTLRYDALRETTLEEVRLASAAAEAAERRAAGLEAALREIATWWENWMPDNTVEEGGLDALDAARAALADPASALAAHDAETRRAALREISGAVVAAQARERQRTMPHPLEAAPPAALRWLAEACKRALAEDK